MENENEEFKLKINNYNELKNISNSKINKILSLQILNLIFIFILLYYSANNKNIFLNKQKLNTVEEKINFLKLLTNNDESEYKGIKNAY